ncbi:hypothetical protein BDN72DRAFT_846907 [Pluteus cervinus]|uniref:Uncharacterized protein n=1 Tax=Pluteus cervinus TaxID=181527 RepID=A0ACD3AEP5_9AGAR|nr:hypothetical protein BDN72DRAFT_846907 [Pluteus cervinus]
MATLEDFESLLKTVVNAKRLSASKMETLREIAMKSMENDTQLVSILYRTHKSLAPAAKVNSLYIFDALSRAARQQVVKHSLTGDIHMEPGNCATFLLKVEGVLEGLFRDMIKIGNSECKEKAKKILDIWVKGSTFPPPMLAQLTDIVEEKEKVPEINTTSDPRMNGVPPPTNASSPITPFVPNGMDPQATLLALLTQAAKAATISPAAQTIANINPAQAQGDAGASLAVLQRFAHPNNSSLASTIKPPPYPTFVPASNAPPSPQRTREHSPPKDPRYGHYHNPDGPRHRSHHPTDDPGYPRDSYRGGPRGRGRGDSRRWEDRDFHRDRDYSPRDRSPTTHRARRSRSRSPPSRFNRRDPRTAYSPPSRPAAHAGTPSYDAVKDSRAIAAPALGKDEFGRDIRTESPEPSLPKSPQKKSNSPHQEEMHQDRAIPSTSTDTHDVESAPALANNHDRMSITPLVAGDTSSNNSNASFVSNTLSAEPGMESFDMTTFDFTSPSSWEGLGKMWQVTNGYTPSAEELMQFIMMGGHVPVVSQVEDDGQAWSGWGGHSGQQRRGGRGRGHGGFRGRGGHSSYGKGRDDMDANHGAGWGQDFGHDQTDAVVLGGGSSMEAEQDYVMEPSSTTGSGTGGRMQKVGDKWVFVREPGVAMASTSP